MSSLFKDMLKSDETLFKNEIALDFDYLPKLIPYREQEQRVMAACIKPLLEEKNGKNLFIFGLPGIGKTAAARHVFRELEEENDDVIPIYINCWQKNTAFKILLHICDALGYKLTHNKRSDELFEVIKKMLNKKAAVFAFDEADKLEDLDFLYSLLEEVYRKSIFLITNHHDFIDNLDTRVKSRLLPEIMEFRQYNLNETRGILKQRSDHAFYPDVFDEDAFEFIVKKAFDLKDIRSGLHLMRECTNIAENKSSKKIKLEHAEEASKKIDEFTVKKSADLASDEKMILDIIKNNSNSKIGDLYQVYQEKGGGLVYKSFQRKIDKLLKNKFISVEKTSGGKDGNTTIVKYAQTKKLTDF